MTLNVDAAADRVNFVTGDSIATTATTYAGANIAAGDVLTFGNGVEVVNNFLAGAGGDVLADGNGAAAATTLIGVATGAALTAATTYFLSGTYNSVTGVFTASADGAGADTLIVDGAGATLAASTGAVVLVGVDSDNLVAANFI